MADIHRHCPHCGHRLGIDGWATMDQGSNGYRYGGQIECCRRVPAAWRKSSERNHMQIEMLNKNGSGVTLNPTFDPLLAEAFKSQLQNAIVARNNNTDICQVFIDGELFGTIPNTHGSMTGDLAVAAQAIIDTLTRNDPSGPIADAT